MIRFNADIFIKNSAMPDRYLTHLYYAYFTFRREAEELQEKRKLPVDSASSEHYDAISHAEMASLEEKQTLMLNIISGYLSERYELN